MLTTVSNSVAPLMSLSALGLSGGRAGLSPSLEVLRRCRSASLRAFVFLSPAAHVLWWSVGDRCCHGRQRGPAGESSSAARWTPRQTCTSRAPPHVHPDLQQHPFVQGAVLSKEQ